MATFNEILFVFLAVYLAQLACSVILEKLNCTHLKRFGGQTALRFEGFIDRESLEKITAYTQEKSRLSVLQELTEELIFLGLIVSGFLVYVDSFFVRWTIHEVWAGLLFFGVIGILLSIAGLPFDYFHTFVIEEKYGFNKSTCGLWVRDHLKAALLSACLLGVVLLPLLWAIHAFPATWWVWGVVIVTVFQIGLMVLYPTVIAPLFNRFEPLADTDLAAKVKELLEGAGIRAKELFQMDAGRRSRHTNAYFTGIGKAKRVVLFDTLIQRHPHEEILAVLAHEVGHFKGRHLMKHLMIFEASSLGVFFLISCLMSWSLFYSTFGFEASRAHAGLLLSGIFVQKAGFFLRPLVLAFSRRWEREADAYAVRLLHAPGPLARALKRMGADNLVNVAPHPLYVMFHASHPPLGERVAMLESPEA